MSTQYYLELETDMTLQEIAALLETDSSEIRGIRANELMVVTDRPTTILVRSDHDKFMGKRGLAYGVNNNVEIVLLSGVYEDMFARIVGLIMKTNANMAFFFSDMEVPSFVRTNGALRITTDPDVWSDDELDLFRDIPHEFSDF